MVNTASEPEAIPVVSFVGRSNSGKTTFLEKLIGELSARGVCVGTAKRHQHDVAVDIPGKDSYRHAKAGAHVAIMSTSTQLSVVTQVREKVRVEALAETAAREGCDILITEGFKKGPADKFEVSRHQNYEQTVLPSESLRVLITDNPALGEKYRTDGVLVFSLDDTNGVADFIVQTYLPEHVF